jgi:hypothetical protein
MLPHLAVFGEGLWAFPVQKISHRVIRTLRRLG